MRQVNEKPPILNNGIINMGRYEKLIPKELSEEYVVWSGKKSKEINGDCQIKKIPDYVNSLLLEAIPLFFMVFKRENIEKISEDKRSKNEKSILVKVNTILGQKDLCNLLKEIKHYGWEIEMLLI